MIRTKNPSLSVSIISFNEEDNIGRCLSSIHDVASEIVVVDSYSTDNTRAIAERFGARVFTEEWKGHIAQKNSALSKCTGQWILCLDCDEEASPALRESLVQNLRTPSNDGYMINRKTRYLGKWIEHAWYPEWKLRLIKNSTGYWTGYNPHDYLKIDGSVGKLDGDLLHYSFKDIRDHFSKQIAYASVVADEYLKQGRQASPLQIIFHPLHGFIKHYFLKGGLFDGMAGFIIATGSFFYTFLKYVFLWEKQKGRRHE